MDRKVKLSVCITSYNQARYIKAALDSVINQQCDFNFEIVIGDDASDDGTQKILKDYQKRYPELIRLNLNSKNIGYLQNLDRTNRAGRGEYIAIFDGDDIMLPGKLQKQVRFLDKNPDCVLLGHRSRAFLSDSGRTLHYIEPHVIKRRYSIEDLMKYGSFFANGSKMFRKSAYPKSGLNNKIRFIADWHMTLEIALNGTLAYLNETLMDYRVHGESIMRRIKGKEHFEDIKRIVEDFSERFNGSYDQYFSRQMAYAYMIKGIEEMESGERKSAIASFLKSIHSQPFYYRNQYLYLILSFLPSSFYKVLKSRLNKNV